MLSGEEFENWKFKNIVPQNTLNLISDMLYSTKNNIKTLVNYNNFTPETIRTLDRTMNFLAYDCYESDKNVIEYRSFPYIIYSNGFITPDFFVLRHNMAGWEEWRTEKDLIDWDERYFFNFNRWICPLGEKYAKKWGLYYKVQVITGFPIVHSNFPY